MATVIVTAHFVRRLDACRDWLAGTGAPPAVFEGLLDSLFGRVFPTLEQFPLTGRDFLARSPDSLEGRIRAEMLRQRLGGADLREYLADDYLILYAVRGDDVLLLSIRHHRELSFDFTDLWPT